MMASIRIACISLVLFMVGCTGMSEQACVTADWRGIGFEEGVQGRTVGRISTYRQSCSKHGVAPDLDGYRAGHAEGVQVYCTPTNGFDAGRRGGNYQGVCPGDLEPDFLYAYNSGRHLYELESALRGIDNQIAGNKRAQDNIKKDLTNIAATIALDETAVDERVRLVAEAANLGSKFSELETDTEALLEERVVVALELENYQQTLAQQL